MGLAATSFGQNCPVISQCPTMLQTICDPSENDSTLWNEVPYTWSPLLQSADLFEGIIDMNLKAITCPGGGNVSISYKIFLDLDSDFLSETVVSSSNPPPPGIVLANNALNPDYSGGDTLWFDKREIPVSSKFRFTLETHTSNDTLRAFVRWNSQDNPNQFLVPRLPEGQHGILWTITQDGVTRNCQYSFKVTDCASPTLICVNNMSEDIGTDRSFPATVSQFIDFVADNVTINDKLKLSMRKAGTGTGFPTSGGNPVTAIEFDCSTLGAQTLEIWAKDQHGNSSSCNVTLTLTDSVFICSELPKVCARTYWDTTQVIDQVETIMIWEDLENHTQVYTFSDTTGGCNTLDSFPNTAFFIEQKKIDEPLNGVTTLDLLLISKHVLAIETLDEPWKIIAADANFSGSVTTNDVVQLRRLILGIVNELPGNISWRFFTDHCSFPANPFDVTNCSAYYSFDPMPFWAFPEEIRFYGLKTGDVNNSAIVNSAQSQPAEDRSVTTLHLPDIALEAGEIIDIPLRMEQAGNWQGFQCGLPFDATKMELIDVRAGEQLNPQEFAFAQPEVGMLRVSWFDVAPQVLLPQDNLFYLRVKALEPVRLKDVLALPVDADPYTFHSEIYSSENDIRQLQFEFKVPEKTDAGAQVYQPQPNPFTAGTSIPLRLEKQEQVQISVGNLEGKTLYFNTLDLPEGAHLLEIPATAFAENGIYSWQVRIGSKVYQGKLVRL